MNYIKNLLSSKNLKATPQRIAILSILENKGHVSIEELYEIIKTSMPSVSLATVYKNISTLLNHELINEVSVKNAKPKYETIKLEHGHFICEKCGEVQDFTIRDIIIDKKTFPMIRRREVFIYGICEKCIKNIEKSE